MSPSQNNPYEKKCRYERCAQTFQAKRLNQYFCCRQHHILHNNYKARDRREQVKKINAVLMKNFQVLQELHGSGKKEFSENELSQAGLNFLYHTHRMLDETKTRHILFYYSLGILQTENKSYKIVKA